ncbi:MAG TPA: shikimate dehydrogenase [Acidimicrobiia bacterium]|nr:shikimate dehydrogenase [Acidimicrobiia bacterium]
MKFAIVGDPVDHSLSPEIHNAAFAHFGIDARYERLPTARDSFARVVEALRSGDLDGVNVTMPHKGSAYEAVDSLSEAARRTHAVNTIVRQDGRLAGDNTDVEGVRHSRGLLGLVDTPCVVLGTGGAARAAIVACADREVTVMARHPDRATAALEACAVHGGVVEWGVPVERAILINATPIGMHREMLPTAMLEAAAGLIDMVYDSEPTPAVTWAVREGMPVADGIDMLIGQAAAAFEVFTGRAAPIDVMIAAARAERSPDPRHP